MRIVKVVIVLLLSFLFTGQASASCVPGDTNPPPRIIDLKKVTASGTEAVISFTAPTDASGVVAYDIRLNSTWINSQNFTASTKIASPQTPASAGTVQVVSISNLSSGKMYYVGMKSQDGCGRWSYLSNVIMFTTLPPIIRQISLQWDYDDLPIGGFRVYYGKMSRSASGFVGYSAMVTVEKSSRTVVLSLESGITYYFAVTAFTSNEESVFSNEVTGTL